MSILFKDYSDFPRRGLPYYSWPIYSRVAFLLIPIPIWEFNVRFEKQTFIATQRQFFSAGTKESFRYQKRI